MDFLKEKRYKRILDIGSGVGGASYLIQKQTNAEVIGIDILKDQVDFANEVFGSSKLKFKACDGHAIPFPNEYFDVVMLLEVIEHMSNPGQTLSEINRVLVCGGELIISTPNSLSFESIARNFRPVNSVLKKIESEKQNTGTHLDHVMQWDFQTFYRLVYRHGFIYFGSSFYGGVGFPFSKIKWINILLAKIFKRFSIGMIFKLKKSEDVAIG